MSGESTRRWNQHYWRRRLKTIHHLSMAMCPSWGDECVLLRKLMLVMLCRLLCFGNIFQQTNDYSIVGAP